MKKKILLISYNFPPYPGIGGRRWAKFAKYLAKNGHELHIISSRNPFDTVSEWTNDVAGLNIKELPLNYPSALITYPGGFAGKIRYRLSLLLVKLVSRSNYYDRALFWKKQITDEASKVIRTHKIKNVIVTGAPFHLLFHVSGLKKTFPDINLIVDFRDYWTEDSSLFHFGSLSDSRIESEKQMQSFVIKNADRITAVANAMKDHFNRLTASNKCSTILNGYDQEDFEFLKNEVKKENEKTTFVFTGNLYKNTENIFIPFCDAIWEIKVNHAELYANLRFDFFGGYPQEYKKLVESRKLDCIHFNGQVSLRETLKQIFHADYCMLFLNDVYSFSLSTKFCEYLGLRKRIVLFSKKGISSGYIADNQLGSWIDPDNCLNDLLAVIKDQKKNFPNNPDFDPEQFSVKNITKDIEKLLV